MTQRAIVTIYHDTDVDNPVSRGYSYLGTFLEEIRPRYIHDYLRGESVAVLVQIPDSSDPRDCRKVFFVSREDVRREYGVDNAETRAKAKACLEAQAKEYRSWADGETYGIVWERQELRDDGEWENIDDEGVWGFIGSLDEVTPQFRDYLPRELHDLLDEALVDSYQSHEPDVVGKAVREI